jgi:fermentation-respiration switch protein FrsA (DUF1100 family)
MPAFLLLAVGAYLAFVLALYLAQGRLVYLPEVPSRELAATPERLGLAFEELNLITADEVRIHGWFVPAEDARGVVLFAHGNAGNISHRLDSIEVFNQLGLDVLAFDYRGYGNSAGKPSEAGTYRDIEAAWRELVERRGIAPSRIVLFGRSLGAAVASWMAARQQPAGLIVESAFTSLPDLAGELYPFVPVRLLMRFDYSTQRHIDLVQAPILIIHSRHDEVVPFAHAERLLRGERRVLLEIEGGHNDGFLRSVGRYRSELDRFLDRVLGLN